MNSIEAEKKKLWRYMPLISLLDFLQTRELRFSRADKFEDTQEGYVGLEALLSTVPPELHEKAKQALHRQCHAGTSPHLRVLLCGKSTVQMPSLLL